MHAFPRCCNWWLWSVIYKAIKIGKCLSVNRISETRIACRTESNLIFTLQTSNNPEVVCLLQLKNVTFGKTNILETQMCETSLVFFTIKIQQRQILTLHEARSSGVNVDTSLQKNSSEQMVTCTTPAAYWLYGTVLKYQIKHWGGH